MNEQLADEVKENRHANYDISPLILNRWSPRSMSGEGMTDDELYPLFEAARWAPSSFNSQLWKFIIARRQEKEQFDKFLKLLAEGNQVWCKNSAALVVVCSRKLFEHNDKPARTHAFDTGSAWENLGLEAARRGLVCHGMEGFDYDRAKEELNIPDDYEVHAMIAIGKRAPKEQLPADVQKMEKPNQRRPLKDIIFDGEFGKEIEGLP